MSKDPSLLVLHILQSIGFIEEFIAGCTCQTFSKEQMRYDAILHNLQTMAESTQRLPKELKDRYPKIRWRGISGFRNVLVHNYLEGVDEAIIWSVISEELPPLKTVMLEIKDQLKIIE